jgi:hypothetical protein
MLQEKQDAGLQAAIVKDVGAVFEQALPDVARELVDCEPDPLAASGYAAVLANIVHNAPSWSLRVIPARDSRRRPDRAPTGLRAAGPLCQNTSIGMPPRGYQ